MAHKIIEDLNWRYATKKFDPSAKLSDEELHILMESMRLTASSFGLQAYKVLVIESPEIREKLVAASHGQRPVADASHLFVLCAYTSIREEDVKAYMERIATTRDTPIESLSPFATGILNSTQSRTPEQVLQWTSKQTYIALGQLLHTCASMRIDALPMEGFDPAAYNEILGLNDKNLTATLVCPVGFRHAEDHAQHRKKVRKSRDDFFEFI